MLILGGFQQASRILSPTSTQASIFRQQGLLAVSAVSGPPIWVATRSWRQLHLAPRALLPSFGDSGHSSLNFIASANPRAPRDPRETNTVVAASYHHFRARPDDYIKLSNFLDTSPDTSLPASSPCSCHGVGRPTKPSYPSRDRQPSQYLTLNRRIGNYGNTPDPPRGKNGQHRHNLE